MANVEGLKIISGAEKFRVGETTPKEGVEITVKAKEDSPHEFDYLIDEKGPRPSKPGYAEGEHLVVALDNNVGIVGASIDGKGGGETRLTRYHGPTAAAHGGEYDKKLIEHMGDDVPTMTRIAEQTTKNKGRHAVAFGRYLDREKKIGSQTAVKIYDFVEERSKRQEKPMAEVTIKKSDGEEIKKEVKIQNGEVTIPKVIFEEKVKTEKPVVEEREAQVPEDMQAGELYVIEGGKKDKEKENDKASLEDTPDNTPVELELVAA